MSTPQSFLEYIKDILEAEGDPDRPEWHTPLFHFTRAVKSQFPEGTKVDEAFDEVDKVVRRLGGWGKLEWVEIEDSEMAFEYFAHAWGKIRYRVGEGPLEQAFAKANSQPLETPRGRERRLAGYDRFVSVAYWLQKVVGDRDILLPVRQVAELLGTDKHRVKVWRDWAVADGFLAVTQAHAFHGGVGRATQFRFNNSRTLCCRGAPS